MHSNAWTNNVKLASRKLHSSCHSRCKIAADYCWTRSWPKEIRRLRYCHARKAIGCGRKWKAQLPHAILYGFVACHRTMGNAMSAGEAEFRPFCRLRWSQHWESRPAWEAGPRSSAGPRMSSSWARTAAPCPCPRSV